MSFFTTGMNHHKKTRKFGRLKKVRDEMMKSLALSLVLKGKIKTTDAKARELRPFVEKLVSQGRIGTVASRRALVAKVGFITKVSEEGRGIYSHNKTSSKSQ